MELMRDPEQLELPISDKKRNDAKLFIEHALCTNCLDVRTDDPSGRNIYIYLNGKLQSAVLFAVPSGADYEGLLVQASKNDNDGWHYVTRNGDVKIVWRFPEFRNDPV